MAWLLERSGRDEVANLDTNQLGIDEAFLTFDLGNRSQAWLYTLSEDCHKCPFELNSKIGHLESNVTKISTKHAWTLLLTESDEGLFVKNSSSKICELQASLGQFGIYNVKADKCKIDVISKPVNIYAPLIAVASLLVLIGVILGFISSVLNYCRKKQKFEPDRESSKPENNVQRRRVSSLDTFRGISILLMIFVNDGAGGYQILEHVTWDGLQLADFVFPWFLWIMGVCIPISVKSQLKRKSNKFLVLISIFKRSCILFGLGVMLNTLGVGPKLETLRIFGVLQRFGILYFLTAGICTIFWPTNLKTTGRFLDLRTLFPQWIVHLLLHAAHLLIVFLYKIPGCPTGYFGPGGISENGLYVNCTGGVSAYLDKLILGGQTHLYQNPTTKFVYKTGPFDPEGPYGCLPSLLTVFLGVQAGAILLLYKKSSERLVRWFLWGAVCLVSGFAISIIIPINKNLWSTTFSLCTSGSAFLVLVLCYILIDKISLWNGAPFLYPGMNATIMYVGHMVAYQLWPWHWSFGRMDTHLILLVEALWGVGLWTIIAYILFRKKFFLSI
ncbi:heparan-alpha-glucosaminide N-acetyltransferase [Neocloeon triangulifer]|uniref:heparan-alpha-glucosaminide N-acetyltransferase n=1 Tax=Neocloeon triangulifer TaxID=2078957 RepID=UPI00286F749A|nr:heparan-alpha-glucosaminide N-acetyltransferase [Neocloeon triangulifer]